MALQVERRFTRVITYIVGGVLYARYLWSVQKMQVVVKALKMQNGNLRNDLSEIKELHNEIKKQLSA